MIALLYIDPDSERAENIREQLENTANDIEATIATGRKQAVEKAVNERADIIISREDIDGTTAYSIFKEIQERLPQSQFIVYTEKLVEDVRVTEETIIADYVHAGDEQSERRLRDHLKRLIQGPGTAPYPTPKDEADRITVVKRYRPITDSEQQALDSITEKLHDHFDVDAAFIGLISRDKELFVSRNGWKTDKLERCDSVCTFTILDSDILIVHDLSEDKRFQDIETLQESGLTWYAGMPLRDADGVQIGAICLMDSEDREMTEEDVEKLGEFAKEAENVFKMSQED